MTEGPESEEMTGAAPEALVERLTRFANPDLHDLCDAAEAAILDGGGFGWLSPPERHTMEAYWKGQIQGSRTTFPPPTELHPFRSHPMA